MKLIVGITGASGAGYAVELLRALRERNIETFLVTSEWGEKLLESETSQSDVKGMASHCYANDDMTAPIASSSFLVDGMVIIPATVKTCSEIATAHCGTLITKAADNMLKMHRPLVVCIRDTPLSTPALEMLHKLSLAGAIVMPLSPGFYHQPKDIKSLYKFMAGKALDALGIENNEYKRWGT